MRKNAQPLLLLIAVFFIPIIPALWFMPACIGLIYASLISEMIKNRSQYRVEMIDLLVFALLVLCSLSFYNMDLTMRSYQNYMRSYFGTYLFPAMSFYAVRYTINNEYKAIMLKKVVLLSGFVFSILCCFESVFSFPLATEFDNSDQWIDGRILRAGTIAGGSVHAGATMAALIALTIPMIFIKINKKKKTVYWILIIIELAGLVVIFARAGYIAACVCLFCCILLMHGAKQKWLLIAMGILIIALFAAPSLPFPDWILSRINDNYSTTTRLPRFWAGIAFIRDNIRIGWLTALMGRGYNASYIYGGQFIDSGYGIYIKSDFYLSGGFHNGFLTLISDQGMLAFGIYVGILISAGRRLLSYCKKYRYYKNVGFSKNPCFEAIGWGLIMIGYLITETVHWQFFFPQRMIFYIALAMLFNLTADKGAYIKARENLNAGRLLYPNAPYLKKI
jgi:hypothetical protein